MRFFKTTKSNTSDATAIRELSRDELGAVGGGNITVIHRPIRVPPPPPPPGYLTSLPGYASVGTPLKPTHNPLPM